MSTLLTMIAGWLTFNSVAVLVWWACRRPATTPATRRKVAQPNYAAIGIDYPEGRN